MWKKRKNFIITSIGVISGLLTIITFIWQVFDIQIKKINIVIDLNWFFGNTGKYLMIFTISLSFICVKILYKEFQKAKEKQKNILLHYNSILSILQKWAISDKNKENNYGLNIPSELIYEIKNLFKDTYNKPVNIQIKMIDPINPLSEQDEPFVRTHWSTENQALEEVPVIQRISENSDFINLLNEGTDFFTFSTKNKKLKNRYKSSNPRWMEQYSSCLVLPIRKAEKDGLIIIVGFLCLDSINPDTFNSEVNKIMVPMLQSITDYLYLIATLGIESLTKDLNQDE